LKVFIQTAITLFLLQSITCGAAQAQKIIPGHSLIIALPGKTLSAQDRDLLKEIQPGGVLLLGNNISNRQQTLNLVAAIKRTVSGKAFSGALPLIYVDQEGGRVNRLRLDNAPSASSLGAEGSEGKIRDTAIAYARAARERGIEVVIAPVLDLKVPGSRAIGDRAFSDDPEIAWLFGKRFMDGILQEGLLPVVKHFPGHGAAIEDSHVQLAHLNLTGQALEDTLLPFKNAVDATVPAVLVGHIACPALDPEFPDTPATLSRAMVTGILREHWGYDGFIMTDDMNMKAVKGALEDLVVRSLRAGCDAVIICEHNPALLRKIVRTIALEAENDPQFLDMLRQSRKRLDRFSSRIFPVDIQPEAATAVATQTPRQPGSGQETIIQHKVAAGDTLSKLAVRYGTTTETIRQYNNKNSDVIRIGETLHIPGN